MSASQASAEFDALRREATKLERHLEDRVGRYQQLAQSLTTGENGSDFPSAAVGQRSSLLDAESGMANKAGTTTRGPTSSSSTLDEEEATLAADINRTVSAMTDLINGRMSPCADRTGKSQHALLVKRYREILFDCTADFKKTSAAVSRRREAMELFRGADTSRSGGSGENGGDDEGMDHLLRERGAINNSQRAADAVLGQAAEIRTDLRGQGSTLRGVQGTMAQLAGNVPGLNRLIDNIRKKRNKDDMIVSGVIAACLLFTIWYLFS